MAEMYRLTTIQQLGLRRLVLLGRKGAVVAQLGKLLELIGGGLARPRRGRSAHARRAGSDRVGRGAGAGLRELAIGLADQKLGPEQREQGEGDDPSRRSRGGNRVPDEKESQEAQRDRERAP